MPRHFPRAVVVLLMAAGVLIRHFFVARHRARVQGRSPPWGFALAGCALIVGAIVWLAPHQALPTGSTVSFSQVQTVMQQRCMPCHSATPTDEAFKVAPNGIIFDSPEQAHLYAERIAARAVLARTMPLANRTNMTDEERATLGRWVAQGAHVDR